MKKMLFYIALFAGAMTIGSCSQDEMLTAIEEKPDVTQPLTSFVSGDPETTRTTTHYKSGSFPFYWTKGDHIWVYKNDAADAGSTGYNQFNHSHSGSTFSEHESEVGSAGGWVKGHFSVSGVFKGNTYNVYYVGQASPSIPEGTNTDNYAINGPLKVTVKNEQMQLTAYNADHFATSGDCGYAEATKVTNGYKFKMNHMASYLMIYPWHDIIYSGGAPAHLILDKITIEEVSDGGPFAIAGTHEISNGQKVLQAPMTGTKETKIVLECGPEEQGFVIPYNEIDYTRNGCFVVMSPSRDNDAVKTRKLKMTFDYYDVFHRHFSFPYTMNEPKTFYGNTFRRFYPKITGEDIDPKPDYDNLVFYGWDGLHSHNGDNNSMANTHDTYWPAPAYQSCKYAPNINELYWYWKNGDMRWDDGAPGTSYTYHWEEREGNPPFFPDDPWVKKSGTFAGGIWVKRREAILRDGNAATCQHPSHVDYKPTFCSEHAQNGEDWRAATVYTHSLTDSGNVPTYSNKGRPENLDDYFFLPALGYSYTGNQSTKPTKLGTEGYYWSSSQTNGYSGSENGYYLKFQKQGDGVEAEILNQQRGYGYIAGSGWFH